MGETGAGGPLRSGAPGNPGRGLSCGMTCQRRKRIFYARLR